MIYIPKTTVRSASIGGHVGLRGFFKMAAIRKTDGRRRLLADWFPNIITNGGRNEMATSGYIRWCHVGDGSAEPAVSDTSLAGFVASTSSASVSQGNQSSAPYYNSLRRVFLFDEGAAEGNLSEVATSWVSSSAGPIFSRALIKDEFDEPTTITVLADEFLEVTYELRIYPPTDDLAFNLVDQGPAETTHGIIVRPADVTSHPGFGGAPLGWGHTSQTGASIAMPGGSSGGSFNRPRAYDGEIQGVTQLPSGSGENLSNSDYSTLSYVTDSFTRKAEIVAPFGSWNFSIGAMRINFRAGGTWQIGFDPNIVKDNEQILELDVEVTWDNYDPE